MSVVININVTAPSEAEPARIPAQPTPKLLREGAAVNVDTADVLDFVPDELLELFGELGIGEDVVRSVLAESTDIVKGLIEKAIQ